MDVHNRNAERGGPRLLPCAWACSEFKATSDFLCGNQGNAVATRNLRGAAITLIDL